MILILFRPPLKHTLVPLKMTVVICYTSLNAQETIWCTQEVIAELFSKSRSTITEHLQNIFKDGELKKEAVCRKFRRTAANGKNYSTQFYNLDAIISVGYRANSTCATQFRQWATAILRQFAIRGYVLDKKRMENGALETDRYLRYIH